MNSGLHPQTQTDILAPLNQLAAMQAVTPPGIKSTTRPGLLQMMLAPIKNQTQQILPPPGKTLTNVGRIMHMTLPAGWTDGRHQEPTSAGSSYFREYRAPSSNQTAISIFFRGKAMGLSSSMAFQKVLYGDTRCRELTTDEIRSLHELLKDKCDRQHFTILSARTQLISGKRVVIVQGRYKQLNEESIHVYIDADGRTGLFVQEIFFQAASADFIRFVKAAKDSLNSIVWREV
jgi:hypothetical protein